MNATEIWLSNIIGSIYPKFSSNSSGSFSIRDSSFKGANASG